MAMSETIPCGGCGATKDRERCIGCLHDFGDEASAWVRQALEEAKALSERLKAHAKVAPPYTPTAKQGG
jgi:predicted Fe-S protein YdhL (DUF1289 family)